MTEETEHVVQDKNEMERPPRLRTTRGEPFHFHSVCKVCKASSSSKHRTKILSFTRLHYAETGHNPFIITRDELAFAYRSKERKPIEEVQGSVIP